jgi:hypothetical protein
VFKCKSLLTLVNSSVFKCKSLLTLVMNSAVGERDWIHARQLCIKLLKETTYQYPSGFCEPMEMANAGCLPSWIMVLVAICRPCVAALMGNHLWWSPWLSNNKGLLLIYVLVYTLYSGVWVCTYVLPDQWSNVVNNNHLCFLGQGNINLADVNVDSSQVLIP